ncbi:MAG TPA: acyl-ACP--UDP-N-acetylglucosamine O-acyltransferase [Vicinamibacterales bacterium]|nr:acyl-ACP--UDP-N-acetylglucosamine O-acyltransferase [Vicinamibacterales bacterium]
MSPSIHTTLDRLCYRYPSLLVDAVTEHDPGKRLVAVKNVTVNEDFFQGHFPGTPVMPGVLMIETLAQVATLLLFSAHKGDGRAFLRGVENAKFRRQVVPGDRVRLEVSLGRRRGRIARASGIAYVGEHIVAEADLILGIKDGAADGAKAGTAAAAGRIHPTAIIGDGADIGEGTVIEPYAVIGPNVKIGRDCHIATGAVVDGWTSVGDGTRIFPYASVGLIPQDLKFKGEITRLEIGARNLIREFVTIHRGTQGGGGVTTIGDDNVFMAYAHVAHDCHVGHQTIFGNGATLGGHVTVEDFATISAFSGIHQFCRVGRHAFIGGFSVVTKDALPYAKTVGNRARIYGLNTIGLARRGFSNELLAKLKKTYRYLLTSKLNTSRALEKIERDPALRCPEVQYLVDFIRESKRGVILRRPVRKVEDMVED